VAHRRAGKTVACINDLIRAAATCTKEAGRFSYVAPYYSQAKSVAWEYLKKFSQPLLAQTPNESELRVDLFNGSRVRLFGGDNADALRGIYNDGVVLDEYPLMRPSVWGEVIRPTLSDRKGWATFIGTPKGRAGLYDIWKGREQWEGVEMFRLMLKASETGIIDASELEDAKRTMTEDQYSQEYECSFDAAIQGAVYGKLMVQAEKEQRICPVPYDPAALVYTAWDLGVGDPTAILFAQPVGKEFRIIDWYEADGVDLAHYANVLRQKPYNYGGHILPHDADQRELGTGKSRVEVLKGLGLRDIDICPNIRREDGINAARLFLARCYFDTRKCAQAIEALKLYRYEYDEKAATLKNTPVHDWTSHTADAFRYLALRLEKIAKGGGFHKPLKYPDLGIV
jgi:phage terminase large subunit